MNVYTHSRMTQGGCREQLLEFFQGEQSQVDAVLNSVKKMSDR